MNASAKGKRRAFLSIIRVTGLSWRARALLDMTSEAWVALDSFITKLGSLTYELGKRSSPCAPLDHVILGRPLWCQRSDRRKDCVCVSRRFLSPDALMCRLYHLWWYCATSFNIFHLVLEVLWCPDVRVLVFVADVRSILWLRVGLRVTQLQTVLFSLKHSELSWIVSTTTGSIYV